MSTVPQTQNVGFGGEFATPQQLRGDTAKWDKENGWHDGDGMALPSPMLIIGTDQVLIRYHPKYEESRDKPLPSAALLNSTIPKEEWREGLDHRPEPPWKLNYEIRMIDPVSGKLYTYRNSTFGAKVCWERLNEQVFTNRLLRGPNVLPLAKLEKRPLPTSYGIQSRPHCEPIEFRDPGTAISLPSAPPAPQLMAPEPTPRPPAPQTAAAEPAPSEPAARPVAAPPTAPAAPNLVDAMKAVKPIPMEEFISDSLPPLA
jgi:hypothetical protein